MPTSPTSQYSVSFSEQERLELLKILEAAVVETHAERRRTEAPAYHAEIVHEESVLRGLLEKVRRLGV